MRRLHPPIHLLKAFTTTARLGSVSRAGDALHLSQSAVSKQISELEQITGVLLFERVRKRLFLSAAGLRYEAAVRPILGQLEAATLELITGNNGGGALHISSLPTFGAKCLIPRLPQFQAAHPQITLHFVPYVHGYDFSRADLDCSILFGTGHWPGAAADYIAGHEMVLITPPDKTSLRIKSAQDVAGLTLLHHVSVPDAWTQWAHAHEVSHINTLAGPQLDQFHSIIRAVMAGMGAALVPQCLVKDDIAVNNVATPLPIGNGGGYLSESGYYLCYPEVRGHSESLAHFRRWLLSAV